MTRGRHKIERSAEEVEERRLENNRYHREYYAQRRSKEGKAVATQDAFVEIKKRVSAHYRPRFREGEKPEPKRCLYCHHELNGSERYPDYCSRQHYLAAFREYRKPLAG